MKVRQYDYSNELLTSHVNNFRAQMLNGLTSAEVNALEAENEKEKKDAYWKGDYERNMRKYKENNRRYFEKKVEEKEMAERRLKEERVIRKEKGKINDVIRNSNMSHYNKKKVKFIDENVKVRQREVYQEANDDGDCKEGVGIEERKVNAGVEAIEDNKDNDQEGNEIKENDERVLNQEQENDDQKEPQIESQGKDDNQQQITQEDPLPETNTLTINIQPSIDHLFQSHLQANKTINSFTNSTPNHEIQDIIHKEISSNLRQITSFRKTGHITPSSHPHHNPNNNPSPNSQSKPSLQKHRFYKALKNILSERLGAKNIHLPNICSCGQLQKNLDMLISEKNISVYTVFNITCANNCIYYKRKDEYMKSIDDIMTCVRDLSFEAFYKNERQDK